ncbi:MAG: hypothetical protein ABIP95_09355 [Pelobium sp.]
MQKTEGYQRFYSKISSFQKILDQAQKAEHPALEFYQSSARQVLFYLEALARIYKKIYDKKQFKSFQNTFKELEDQLGKIDFYDAYWKEFSSIKDFPSNVLNVIKQHYFNELHQLGEILTKENWLKADGKLKGILENLDAVEWLPLVAETQAIAKVMTGQIEKLETQYNSGKLNFDDIESGVHEFRRKIRWISIGAHALDGLIQLKKDEYDVFLKGYLTKEVLTNKYNKLPEMKKGIPPIFLSQSAFYALSWLINESGILKDNGLKVVCVEEALKEIGDLKEDEIQKTANSLTNSEEISLKDIKERMKFISDHFVFTDRVFDILIKDLKLAIEASED